MGILARLLRNEPLTPAAHVQSTEAGSSPSSGPTFALDIDPGVLYGTPTIDDYIRSTARIARRHALSVPAVKAARDRIVGAIGQMPLELHGPDGKVESWSLFNAPEAGTAPSVTWTRVAEDLIFDGRAWLHVTHVGWHGKPAQVVRLDPTTVTVVPKIENYGYGTAEVWPEIPGLIRIDSPHPALLEVGARAIRVCLALQAQAAGLSEGMPPITYFTPADDADPYDLDDEDDREAVQQLLDDWYAARAKGNTAYVPAALKLNTLGWNPEQMQLVDMRREAILEIARITGVDPEELGVSTTSRTYQNQQDRRRDQLDFTDGPYMTAIEGRLSLDDVTPRGWVADFDTTSFLRSDDKTRAETDKALVEARIIHPEEARASRGLTGPAPEPKALPAKTEEPANAR